MKKILSCVALGVALVLAGCSSSSSDTPASTSPTESQNQSAGPQVSSTIATGLEAPWGVAFLPDGTAIVTERDTRKVLAIKDGETQTVGTVSEAQPEGEGGLLGVAASPDFAKDQTLFLYYTARSDNRVATATYSDGRLGNVRPIVTGIPSGFTHNGGRLAFGPDGNLYVGTGDAGNSSNAQNFGSLGGKILRITKTGDPAPGNPQTNSPVWSLGHRNVQGLAFDESGQLWASEFGQSEVDELNKIVKGGNYGWPVIEGKGNVNRYISPELTWPVAQASPSGLAYADGSLWMAGLRGQRLWRITLQDGKAVDPQDFFVNTYGRLRTAATTPDGQLWVTTSNRDGRGDPVREDDRILAITP